VYVCDELLCVAFCVFKKCSYVVFVVVEFYMKTAHHKTVRAAGGGLISQKPLHPVPTKTIRLSRGGDPVRPFKMTKILNLRVL